MKSVHVVTGASSGVGQALCRNLAGRGLQVLGVARRSEHLAALAREFPDCFDSIAVDLAEPAGWNRVAARFDSDREVRSLTHSAAISTRGYLKDISLASYRQLMAINVEAPLFLTQALLPLCATGARILNISSGAAHRAVEYGGLYCISKAALLMIYRAWNADFPDRRIVAGSARPGVVDGPMQDAARLGDAPGVQMYRDFKDQGLLLPPAKVADFLSWLLLSTSDAEFSAQEWNIYDEAHHPRWLTGPLGANIPKP